VFLGARARAWAGCTEVYQGERLLVGVVGGGAASRRARVVLTSRGRWDILSVALQDTMKST
jgi:hypothetical protein